MAFSQVPDNSNGDMNQGSIDYINSLPIRKVKIAGNSVSCRYDENGDAPAIYLLDSDGNYTGEVKHLKTPLPPEYPSVVNDEDGKVKKRFKTRKQKAAQSDEADKRHRIKLTRRDCIYIAVIIVLALLFGYSLVQCRKSNSPVASQSMLDDEYVSVIVTSEDILPGTALDASMFTKAVITAEEYNDIKLISGRSIYTWDACDFIEGMQSSSYIPAGTYLPTDNVVYAYFTNQSNPYTDGIPDGYDILYIPANITYEDLCKVYIGAIADISISKITDSGVEKPLETAEVEGLEHSSAITASTTTDVYTYRDIVIADMLNSNGDSLFDVLARYNDIPDGELQQVLSCSLSAAYASSSINGDADVFSVFPEFYVTSIAIIVPTTHISAIGTLRSDNTQLTISDIGSCDISSTAKKAYAAENEFIRRTLCDVLAELDR